VKAILVLAALLSSPVQPAGPEAAASPRVPVELHVFPAAVDSVQAPRVVLVNTGDRSVSYGYGYKLERKTREGWRWINRRQASPLVILVLKPGKSAEPERIGIYRPNPKARCPHTSEPCCLRVPLRRGLYRVTKDVSLDARQLTVRATFRVLDRQTGTAE
jgi:hypothetical protein